MSAASPVIINVALTGMLPTKDQTPYVPVTPDEVVACCRRVRDAGAAVVHLHARDEAGRATSDGAAYERLVAAVRAACPDLIVCVSLSGRRVATLEQRAAPLQARPDLASLTVGSLNLFDEVSVNSLETVRVLAARIEAAGAAPELEVFDTGFVNTLDYLVRKGILRAPYYVNIILGALGGAPLDLAGLGHMVNRLPAGATWSVGGIGRYQLDANVMALAAGGHVRTGIEDNPYQDRARTEPADNVRLVERIVRIAREMGREPASPAEARRLIGLPGLVAP
jgi:uncharacterized protein (DUF849 family)